MKVASDLERELDQHAVALVEEFGQPDSHFTYSIKLKHEISDQEELNLAEEIEQARASGLVVDRLPMVITYIGFRATITGCEAPKWIGGKSPSWELRARNQKSGEWFGYDAPYYYNGEELRVGDRNDVGSGRRIASTNLIAGEVVTPWEPLGDRRLPESIDLGYLGVLVRAIENDLRS